MNIIDHKSLNHHLFQIKRFYSIYLFTNLAREIMMLQPVTKKNLIIVK